MEAPSAAIGFVEVVALCKSQPQEDMMYFNAKLNVPRTGTASAETQARIAVKDANRGHAINLLNRHHLHPRLLR